MALARVQGQAQLWLRALGREAAQALDQVLALVQDPGPDQVQALVPDQVQVQVHALVLDQKQVPKPEECKATIDAS